MSQKKRNRFENSNGNCFIFISIDYFYLNLQIIRINFDIFSSILGDLTIKMNISKLQNCPFVKTRAAALETVNYNVKL